METMSADDPFSTEYRLLEIYYKRRKSKSRHTADFLSARSQQPRNSAPTRRIRFQASCSKKTDAFAQVADELSKIVDSVPPAQDQVITDTDVIQRLIELLKEFGDQVNEKIEKDEELLKDLQDLFSYSLYEKLASAFIRSTVPSGKQRDEDNDQKIKIAWIFEMTSRLSALDLHPMNRAMGFGAQYVHKHFSPWIQHHGGWENAFKIDEDDEVQ